jgi:hypothetical protein
MPTNPITIPQPKNSLRVQLAMTTALASVFFSYGGRQVYAGACTGAVGVYNCSGVSNPVTDTTQTISGAATAVNVTTSAGFGIDSSSNSINGAINVENGNFGITVVDNNASTITGTGFGIQADNAGTGNISITSNGQVNGVGAGTAYNPAGIVATNTAVGGNIQITANGVSGANNGIYASGSGDIDITTNGTVTGNGNGIASFPSGGNYSNTIIVNGSVSGTSYNGISATNYGGGYVSVTVASGGSASGGQSGINSLVSTYSVATITVSGTVTGGSNAGINSNSIYSGGTTNIILNNGANVSATSGVAISNGNSYANTANVTVNSGAIVNGDINLGDGTDTAFFNAGATINGSVNMGDGTDSVTFNGVDLSNVGTVDGGSGNDTLTIANANVGITNNSLGTSGQVVNFENITIASGGNVAFLGGLNSNTVTVQNGGSLSAGNLPIAANITGSLDLGTGAKILAELGGISAGQYDQIDVANTITVDAGAIFDVDFINGFSASLGDFFDILVADSFVGDVNDWIFDISGAGLFSGLVWGASIVSAGGSDEALRLTVIATVPEPSTLITLSAGLFGLYRLRRRRKTV